MEARVVKCRDCGADLEAMGTEQYEKIAEKKWKLIKPREKFTEEHIGAKDAECPECEQWFFYDADKGEMIAVYDGPCPECKKKSLNVSNQDGFGYCESSCWGTYEKDKSGKWVLVSQESHLSAARAGADSNKDS